MPYRKFLSLAAALAYLVERHLEILTLAASLNVILNPCSAAKRHK
jgi:hypothetical protein